VPLLPLTPLPIHRDDGGIRMHWCTVCCAGSACYRTCGVVACRVSLLSFRPCRSFNLLDEALDAALDGDESATGKVEGRMQATRDNMDRFDRSIRQCLHMA